MPTQARVGLNLKARGDAAARRTCLGYAGGADTSRAAQGSLLAHREHDLVAGSTVRVRVRLSAPYPTTHAPPFAARRQCESAAGSWRYSPQAAGLLRAYVAAVPALPAVVLARLYALAGSGTHAWSPFVVGLHPDALAAAVAWRAAHLPSELLARDGSSAASAGTGRGDVAGFPVWRAPKPTADAASAPEWRSTQQPQQQQPQQAAGKPRGAPRVLTRLQRNAPPPGEEPPKRTAAAAATGDRPSRRLPSVVVPQVPPVATPVLVPAAAPERPAWRASGASPAAPAGGAHAPQPPPLRAILAEEEQGAQRRAAASMAPPTVASAAHARAQPAPLGAPPRVLRAGEAPPVAKGWAQVAAAPAKAGMLRAAATAPATGTDAQQAALAALAAQARAQLSSLCTNSCSHMRAGADCPRHACPVAGAAERGGRHRPCALPGVRQGIRRAPPAGAAPVVGARRCEQCRCCGGGCGAPRGRLAPCRAGAPCSAHAVRFAGALSRDASVCGPDGWSRTGA
jgi:hypothetical protein